MAKIDLAILVGQESKEWLLKLEDVLERLEKVLDVVRTTTAPKDATPAPALAPEKEAPAQKEEGRKRASKKAQKEEAGEIAETVEQETESLDDLFGEEEKEDEPVGPTVDDVRKVIKEFAAKNGKAKALKLLEKFKADSIPQLKEEHYVKLIELAKKYI